MIEALVYLLAITAAEFVTAVSLTVWGITLHILILVVIIWRSAIVSRQTRQQLLLSLALAPLVRIISLSMPLADIPRPMWYPIIYGSLLAAAIVVARILNFRAREIGVNLRSLPIQFPIALTGFVFGVAEYLILRPEESVIGELTWGGIWLAGLIFLMTTGVVEEFIFRGVMQQTAWREFGWWGIIYVSLLFAVLHMGFLSWIDVVFVFGVALFFGWLVKRTGSLLGVTLAHGITNIMLYLVMPLLF